MAPDIANIANSPDAVRVDQREAKVANNLQNIEHSKLLPWLMLCAMFSGFAVAFSCFTFYQLTRTEREYALLKNQQEMTNAWLARAGLIKPLDAYNGPEGNFFYNPKEKR